MSKQKMLIEVSMHCEKCRSKAMKIAAPFPGVESVSWKGYGKLEITGIEVDVFELTSKLRKNVRFAKVVSLEDVKPEEKKPEVKKAEEVKVHPVVCCHEVGFPNYYQPVWDDRVYYTESSSGSSCPIL